MISSGKYPGNATSKKDDELICITICHGNSDRLKAHEVDEGIVKKL